MNRIIGFTGRKFSGKDTAAQALHGRQALVAKFSFAYKLKAIAREIWGLELEQTDGLLKEVVDPRWGLTPREIMQRLGAEVARSIHTETWVRHCLDRQVPAWFRAVNPPGVPHRVAVAAITDCRFPNEAVAIRDRGGLLLRVVRPGLAANAYSHHSSEQFIDTLEVDHEIVNDGTVEQLHAKVHALAGV
jgi:hypothetical protein